MTVRRQAAIRVVQRPLGPHPSRLAVLGDRAPPRRRWWLSHTLVFAVGVALGYLMRDLARLLGGT